MFGVLGIAMHVDTETLLFVLFIMLTPVISEVLRAYLGWREIQREKKAFREYMAAEKAADDALKGDGE